MPSSVRAVEPGILNPSPFKVALDILDFRVSKVPELPEPSWVLNGITVLSFQLCFSTKL